MVNREVVLLELCGLDGGSLTCSLMKSPVRGGRNRNNSIVSLLEFQYTIVLGFRSDYDRIRPDFSVD